MIIYKYGLNKDLEFKLVPCEVVEEGITIYRIQVEKAKVCVEKSAVEKETFNNRVMYSFSPDKAEEYFKQVLEDFDKVISGYESKAQSTRENKQKMFELNRKYFNKE